MKTIHHAILVGVLAFLLLLAVSILDHQLSSPPEVGDAPDYDNIAFQLSRGLGFSFDWDNPAYQAPYRLQPQEYAYLLSRTGSADTAYRPPLYPTVMAATYLIFGRTFIPIRVLDFIFLAVACALGFWLVVQRSRLIFGYLFALLFVDNAQTLYFSATLLTESLACLLTTLSAYCILHFAGQRDTKSLVGAGILMGLAILNRSIFSAWLPFLLLLVIVIGWRDGWKTWLARVGLVAGLALLVTLPWMVRNTLLLREFMPFGTQSGTSLPSGYSDLALANIGKWVDPWKTIPQDSLPKNGLALEVAKANIGQALGMAWIKANLFKIPQLAFYKVLDLWGTTSFPGPPLLLFALIGLLLYPNNQTKLILTGFLLMNTAAVAASWSGGDRFLFPILPVILILFCGGIAHVFSRLRITKFAGLKKPTLAK